MSIIIETIKQFNQLLNEDYHLNNSIKLAFLSNYEHACNNSINTANEVAAQYTYDDLISDAFTEDIEYNVDEEKLKEFLMDKYAITMAFTQSGLN
jgi:hypothetical protein